KDQASHTAVAISEWVDPLETSMYRRHSKQRMNRGVRFAVDEAKPIGDFDGDVCEGRWPHASAELGDVVATETTRAFFGVQVIGLTGRRISVLLLRGAPLAQT
ncbi:MAG TPA: hypothetical protein VF293_03460, partial [Candidatus Limnocylindrales bacterium]